MFTAPAAIGWPTWQRVLFTWCVLAVAMSANGVFREIVLRPHLRPPVPAVLSAVIGILLLLAVTRALFPPLRPLEPAGLLQVSAALLLLTVCFESAIGIVVDRKSWSALLEHYALWRGELWPIVLASLVLTPFIWGRWWPPVGT